MNLLFNKTETKEINLSSLLMFNLDCFIIDVPNEIKEETILFLEENMGNIKNILSCGFLSTKSELNLVELEKELSLSNLKKLLSKEFLSISNINNTVFYWKYTQKEFSEEELKNILEYSETFQLLKNSVKYKKTFVY